jgi:hypothetical protein
MKPKKSISTSDDTSSDAAPPSPRKRPSLAPRSPQNSPGSSTDESETDPGYEVEAIVGHRLFQGRHQYLLKWKSFPSDDNTWEDEADLNCPDLIQEFNRQSAEPSVPVQETVWNSDRLATFPFPEPIVPEPAAPIKILSALRKDGGLIYTFERSGEILRECGSSLRLRYPVEILDFFEEKGYAKLSDHE